MNNAEENGQHENADEEESLYIPNWFVEVMESITREEMISRGICTSSRLFQLLCWPKLHGKVEPHRVEYLQISHNYMDPLTYYRRSNQEWRKYCHHSPTDIPQAIIKKMKPGTNSLEIASIPQVAPPNYITGFGCIDICFFNENVMEFMKNIAPLLKNCTIKCEMFMGGWKADEKRTQQLRQFFMMILMNGKISMLFFTQKRFYYFQQLFPEVIDQVECLSIEERNIDFEFLLNWLKKKRNYGGQKILSLGSNGVNTKILDGVKKEFSISTGPTNFLIWQQNFEHEKFKMENGIGEILELYENSKGQCFLARFPKGEDHWKEVGEKKIWPSDDEELPTNINLNIESKSADGSHIDIDSNWEVLRVAIQKILEKKEITGLSFGDLYRYAYMMAMHHYGQMLYYGISEIIREHFQTKIREILTKLIDNNDNEQFTENLNNEWKEFNSSMSFISEICMYLDRTFVGINGLLPLDQLGLHIFKMEIVNYPPINQHLKKIFGGNLKGKIDDSLFDFLSKHI